MSKLSKIDPASLTIGIPCYNEALTIGKVVDDFRRMFPPARILVIDNASTDETANIAEVHGAEVIAETRKGKGNAVQRLFRETTSAYLIMVDGDDTYPAEEAVKLIATAEINRSDTVVGCRVSSDTAAFKTAHTWANDFLSWVIKTIFGASCGDLFSGYRLFNKTFYRTVPLLSSGFEIETELALQTIDKGYSQHDVGIDFRSRPEGSESKLHTFRDGFRVLRAIALIVKDFKPMLFFTSLGLAFLFCSLAVGIFPVIDYLRYRYIYHVPLAILATGLATFFALSMVCGVILDTLVRYEKEQALIRIRNLELPARN